MADETWVDWAGLRRSAEGLGTAYEDALTEVRAFQERMAGYGAPWGVNNVVSQAIGLCYGAARDEHATCHTDNLDAYGGYPAGMRAMAGNGRLAEQDTAAMIGSVQ
ncbi:hypothetical protein SAMN05444920_117115 [Nonomuraea solani]|uniref:Excreted virulence factor EspC, type VII ESX diderm n=1 Tax=Nonomuraea solani TaxID=1144553 RepID=A0A1H6EVG6_9ACTN|nr:hypothetical protein [Nonomuraea solani]SEH00684.1 hypothetical protein SAMN05444920_117115 [Nonomuraea solani]